MSMVQFGMWSNCTNRCDFCLLKERDYISKEEQLHRIEYIIENINYIDWNGKFRNGISLLGGELYGIVDPDVQNKFLELIDTIIEKIIKKVNWEYCFYSTVTNGIYNPEFLFRVIDKFKDQGLLNHVDINFSYDLKYRFHSEESRKLCLENIKKYNDRYGKKVSVQMILTQHVINEYNAGRLEFNDFVKNVLNDNQLNLLYPHTVRTGKVLDDFFFNRKDFIKFILSIREKYPGMCNNFIQSVINSSKFKYAGYYDRKSNDVSQQPVLEDDKVVFNNDCGHSVLYQCYDDCDRCMLCDIEELGD